MKPALPTIGRIAHITLSLELSSAINRDPQMRGNATSEGETYPFMITRVWPEEIYADGATVNGQLMLDGPNNRWMTSVHYGESPDCWHWPDLLQAAELIGTLEHGVSSEEARLRADLTTVIAERDAACERECRLSERLASIAALVTDM